MATYWNDCTQYEAEYHGTATHKNNKREKFATTEFKDSVLEFLSLLSKATSCTRF